MDALLEFRDVVIAYGDREVVHRLSLTVPRRRITAVVGESGSGKSTLIRAAAGLMPAGGRVAAGKILFDGRDVASLSGEELRKIRGDQIAMVFQDPGAYLNPRRRIGFQFVESICSHRNTGKRKAGALALSMLERMNLPAPERIMRSYPFELSGGMQQRVSIAMCMAMEPELLLADEPTSALDVTMQAAVIRELLSLRDACGTTIVIVTHNIGVAAYMADCIAIMKEGELVEWGERDRIVNHPAHAYTQQLLLAAPELEVGG